MKGSTASQLEKQSDFVHEEALGASHQGGGQTHKPKRGGGTRGALQEPEKNNSAGGS